MHQFQYFSHIAIKTTKGLQSIEVSLWALWDTFLKSNWTLLKLPVILFKHGIFRCNPHQIDRISPQLRETIFCRFK